MTNELDRNPPLLIVNFVDHAVIPDTQAVQPVTSRELYGLAWERLIDQRLYTLQ
jgi:hypothetical protein